MSLDMSDFIDDDFESVSAVRISNNGQYGSDGRYTAGTPTVEPSHRVNLQPVSDKQLQALSIGAERVKDARRVFVNDGDLYSITPSDNWTFDGINGTFKTISLDNRPWRNYCKIIVSKIDD